jgi:hypothetical protein
MVNVHRNRKGLRRVLSGMKDRHIIALHRVAKISGAMPFFQDPRAMILLRQEAEHRLRLSKDGR